MLMQYGSLNGGGHVHNFGNPIKSIISNAFGFHKEMARKLPSLNSFVHSVSQDVDEENNSLLSFIDLTALPQTNM